MNSDTKNSAGYYSAANIDEPWEDDNLRSRYVRRLVHGTEVESPRRKRGNEEIPKVIVQFWHARAELPRDVRACLDSWRALESEGFSIVLFDQEEARHFIAGAFGDRHVRAYDVCYHPAMRCDYFRLCYILANGGFYADADDVYQGANCEELFADTRLKVQALCYDMSTDTMVSPDVFFHQRKSSASWIFYVNNNPIVAPAGHPVVQFALDRATLVLLSSRERPGIQSTTGPGNFTASLVRHAIASAGQGIDRDFMIMGDWEKIAVTQWPLSYRNDKRNWRLVDG